MQCTKKTRPKAHRSICLDSSHSQDEDLQECPTLNPDDVVVSESDREQGSNIVAGPNCPKCRVILPAHFQ